GCGLSVNGGIVDNGNKPADPTTSKPTTPDADVPSSSDPVTPVDVLSQYIVDVPSKWPVDKTLESNIITFNGQSVLFVEGTEVCPAKSVLNDYGVRIYACSPKLTIL